MSLSKAVNDSDAVEYQTCLDDVINSCFGGDSDACPDVFKRIKVSKHIDYLSGLHKFDELIKMFCTDSQEKLNAARVAFEIERVFSTLLTMQKKKKKGGSCTGLISSLESAPATFIQPQLKKHASLVAQLFSPEKHSISNLGASLAIVCPGFESDKDAPVNVDSERRAIIKSMGSSNGVAVIEDARTSFKAREEESSMDKHIRTVETNLENIDQHIASMENKGCDIEAVAKNFIDASGALDKLKAAKRKPKLVQDKLAELKERFESHTVVISELDLARYLRQFLDTVKPDVVKVVQGEIRDEKSLVAISETLDSLLAGARMPSTDVWKLVPEKAKDSYTSLSKLFTTALEVVRWVMLCRCEGDAVELSQVQHNNFTKFVENGEKFFIGLKCNDEWADFKDQIVQVLINHNQSCRLFIIKLSRCSQPIVPSFHHRHNQCHLQLVTTPSCHLLFVISRAILSSSNCPGIHSP